MSNIAISDLNTEATSLASDDLFLVSKKDGSSYTSAKLKAVNANGLANVRFVEGGEVVCYIAPNGSDDNADLQWKYWGTDQQKNYPLYTLNKACDFLGKFRCIPKNNQCIYTISCAEGVYSYDTEQDIHHPECSVTGSYVLITPTTDLTTNTKVQFKFTQPINTIDGNVAIRHYCNCQMRCCHITSTNNLNAAIYLPDIVRSTIYGVKITDFYCGISIDSRNWCNIASMFTDNGETLSNHIPTEISSVSIGIISNGNCNITGCIKIDSAYSCIVSNGGRIYTAYWNPLKFDFKTQGVYIFESWSPDSITLLGESTTTRSIEINTFSTQKTYTSIDELFNIKPNNQEYNYLGYIHVHDKIATALSAGLNQDKV